MKGIYRIYVSPSPGAIFSRIWHEEEERKWHSFLFICRSLVADGLQYRVVLERIGERVALTVRAWGRPLLRPLQKRKAPASLPSPLSKVQCQARLEEARKDLAFCYLHVRTWMQENVSPSSCFPRGSVTTSESRERYRIGRAIAKIIARYGTAEPLRFAAEDYAELDLAAGRRALRASELSAQQKEVGYLPTIARVYAGCWAPKRVGARSPRSTPAVSSASTRNLIHDCLAARIDREYWEEMVRLCELKKNP